MLSLSALSDGLHREHSPLSGFVIDLSVKDCLGVSKAISGQIYQCCLVDDAMLQQHSCDSLCVLQLSQWSKKLTHPGDLSSVNSRMVSHKRLISCLAKGRLSLLCASLCEELYKYVCTLFVPVLVS